MAINVIFNKFDYEISERKREVWDKYVRIINWGRMHPERFAENFLGVQFTDHQRYIFINSWQAKYIVWVMGRNSGKATTLDTPVYCDAPDQEDNCFIVKTIGDLKIGDKIYDENGKLVEVIHLNPIIWDEVYKVEFEDGEIIECNGQHLWSVCDEVRKDETNQVYDTEFLYDNCLITNPITQKKEHRFCVEGGDLQLLGETGQWKSNKKAIINITKTLSKKAMRCITVSNDNGLFLCGNKGTVTHNSFLTAPYIMTRSMLIPSHETYIMSVTGAQAQATFQKMESLAMGKIASVAGTNRVFLNEVVKANSKDSGFVHDKNSWHTQLYNHAQIRSLNSVPKNIVGIRSNLNVYDEAGKIDQEMFTLTTPFVTQNTNFITGANFNPKCMPWQFPNQILYCSSAEDVFTELYRAYKDGAKEMLMGNPEYFVCDVDVNFSLNPTMYGEKFTPLLEKSVVEEALAQNAFRAHREYYNKFDVSGGYNCVSSKAKIDKCSSPYFPILEWEEGKRYIIVNDPSSKLDNSFVLVAELFEDEEKGLMVKIVNGHNLVEAKKDGSKKVIQKPEQIEILKQYMVKYNGPANDYDNLERVIIDAGSGGGGFDMYQFILPGWTWEEGKRKVSHVGIIDPEDKYCQEVQEKFPQAKEILTLANFKKDKVAMYEATMDAINQQLVIFPNDSNGRGEIEFEHVDDNGKVTYTYETLGSEHLRAILEIEMLKLEVMAMEQTKNTQTGRISFDLMPSKVTEGLHDDRADCLAMLCHYLMKLRAKNKMDEFHREKADYLKLLGNRQKLKRGPFDGAANPFVNRGENPFLH